MKGSVVSIYRPFLRVAIIAAALSLLLACGQAEAPTPTVAPAATATPTKAPAATATPTKAPVATATPTPTIVGPVATPTPTLVATPTPTGPVAEKPRTGGHQNYLSGQTLNSYDYQAVTGGNGRYYTLSKVYNNLLILYGGGKVECEVCSEWRLANNGKTMVFTLIPGIKFHSGQEMTSEDVKYSLRMITGDVDGIVSTRLGSLKEFVESIETPSRYEVRLNLPSASSSYVAMMLAVSVGVIYQAGTTRDDLKKAPAGSGPYLLRTKDALGAATVDMERNPNYFKPGQPYIDTIRNVTVVENNTRIAALLTHKGELYDSPTNMPEQFLPLFRKLVAEGKMSVKEFRIGGYLGGAFMAVVKPPFDNLKLRQAVNLALDRRAYGDAEGGNYLGAFLVFREGDLAMGYGLPESEIWDVLPGWGTGAKKQQEIERAKQLVIDAGYPKGLDIVLMARSDARNLAGTERFQQDLNNIGLFRAKIDVTATQDIQMDRLGKQNFMLSLYTYILGTGAPEEVVGQYWLSGAPRGPTGYANPQVDKLYIEMAAENDPAKKAALYKQIAEIIILRDVAFAEMPASIIEQFRWNRLQGVDYGTTFHPTSSSGLLRGDRLWLKD